MDGDVPLGKAPCWLVLLHARDARSVKGVRCSSKDCCNEINLDLCESSSIANFRYSLILLSSFDIFNETYALTWNKMRKSQLSSDAIWHTPAVRFCRERWNVASTNWHPVTTATTRCARRRWVHWCPPKRMHQRSWRNRLEHGEKQTFQKAFYPCHFFTLKSWVELEVGSFLSVEMMWMMQEFMNFEQV